mmetsp:Transcript_1404/g.5341  ORF Transcript_1404/g.5341 Transcript_1404/m.5341 type:complete len:310 (+) Transcript_1404:653-1582(+)
MNASAMVVASATIKRTRPRIKRARANATSDGVWVSRVSRVSGNNDGNGNGHPSVDAPSASKLDAISVTCATIAAVTSATRLAASLRRGSMACSNAAINAASLVVLFCSVACMLVLLRVISRASFPGCESFPDIVCVSGVLSKASLLSFSPSSSRNAFRATRNANAKASTPSVRIALVSSDASSPGIRPPAFRTSASFVDDDVSSASPSKSEVSRSTSKIKLIASSARGENTTNRSPFEEFDSPPLPPEPTSPQVVSANASAASANASSCARCAAHPRSINPCSNATPAWSAIREIVSASVPPFADITAF